VIAFQFHGEQVVLYVSHSQHCTTLEVKHIVGTLSSGEY
jgi:hypothetical protein